MANNRELSQLASFVTVDDTSKTIAFGSTIASLNVSGVGTFGSLTVGGVPVTAATALHPTLLELNVTGVSTLADARIKSGIVTDLTVTGVTTISAGSISAPSLVGTSSSTGFSFITQAWSGVTTGGYSGDGVMVVSAGSSEVLRVVGKGATVAGISTGSTLYGFPIDTIAYGAIGIGTTNPKYKVHVSDGIIRLDGSAGQLQITTVATKSDPDRLIHVNQTRANTSSSILLSGKTVDEIDCHTLLASDPSEKFHIYRPGSYQTGQGDAGFQVGVANSVAFTINNSGDVGIGTTVPVNKLHVVGGVTITGALSKGSGSFRIPHPVAEGKDLVHSFVEAPRADLIYRGEATLVSGSTSVNLDAEYGLVTGTWESLCRNPQVWVTSQTGWTLCKGSVSGATLNIVAQDSSSTETVSWLVVAERQDAHMYNTDWTDENGRPILEPNTPIAVDPPHSLRVVE